MSKSSNYYGSFYFESFQKSIGEFGGKANLFKFSDYLHKDITILDFGCGGGFLLNQISAYKKIGVEINKFAREHCKSLGIDCYEFIDEIEDESVDLIISNHCLEHTENPYYLVGKLFNKLKRGGRLVVVLPWDRNVKFKERDINNHFYSFSPLNIGNIFQSHGFINIQSKKLLHKWPPGFHIIQNLFGWKLFHYFCYIYGFFRRNWVQVHCVGEK
jgi:SAM-dependent methyltransferase